ncbi:MAG: hypothetical protein EA405_04910 [Rhodospirillales bacterium]|nr:MAG: hypothetical protein EA405_04910 [Rhodospirillales bacterium]
MTRIIEGWTDPPAILPSEQSRADSRLHRLRINGKTFLVLKQRGRFADIAYDHGRLLAPEIVDGVFPEIVATIARSLDLPNPRHNRVAQAVYRCYSDRVLANSSAEFRAGAEALADGVFAGVADPPFSRRQVLDAVVAIEVGNLVDGLARLLEIPVARVREIIGLGLMLGSEQTDQDATAYVQKARRDAGEQDALAGAFRQVTGPNNRVDFACTGFSIPGRFTRDGRHIHARNLDADLYAWNRTPVLFLIDETPANAAWHRYAAFGTAGLIYPGGISGINDAGLAVSLHQLSTTRYRSTVRGDIAPFVQQRILREAATVDEAADIARDSRHFAAWVIFCSEAKTGRAIRIEVNGDGVRVSQAMAEPLAQTNHFLAHDLFERRFDARDAHFTPTFGKWLESRARYFAVRDAMDSARMPPSMDVDWAIDRLSASDDWYLEQIQKKRGPGTPSGASRRSFGRVVRKAYGQLASIVVGDPQRRPGRDEVWMTIGDREPAPHSHYAGWRIDWAAFDLKPLDDRPIRRTRQFEKADLSNWEQGLERYVWARVSLNRPRDQVGKLLRRAASTGEWRAGLVRANHLLGAAIDLAAADGVVEVPYHYMRARVRHALGEYAGATEDWRLLRDIWAVQQRQPGEAATWPAQPAAMPLLHPFEAALVLLLSTATEDLQQGAPAWAGRSARLSEARTLLGTLAKETFGTNRPHHFDLERWIECADAVERDGGAAAALPELNFITVE